MPKSRKDTSRQIIARLRASGKKWREIGRDYPGVPLGTLCRFHKDRGYEPKRPDIRAALGLPAHITIRAVPCASCGEVKTVKRCPCQRKPAPRRQWKRLATWAASMLIYMEGRANGRAAGSGR